MSAVASRMQLERIRVVLGLVADELRGAQSSVYRAQHGKSDRARVEGITDEDLAPVRAVLDEIGGSNVEWEPRTSLRCGWPRPAWKLDGAEAGGAEARPLVSQEGCGVTAALPESYRILVALGVGLGLRQGEVLGLSPDDVDWLRGAVEVQRKVKIHGGHKPVFGLPKGGKVRTVSVAVLGAGSAGGVPRRPASAAGDAPVGDAGR